MKNCETSSTVTDDRMKQQRRSSRELLTQSLTQRGKGGGGETQVCERWKFWKDYRWGHYL